MQDFLRSFKIQQSLRIYRFGPVAWLHWLSPSLPEENQVNCFVAFVIATEAIAFLLE
jgi:hypothetical protein